MKTAAFRGSPIPSRLLCCPSFRMARVFHKHFYLPGSLLLACSGMLFAQQQQPPVKVNVLNVCAPSAEEQKEISSALARVPRQPLFSDDFEVDRGHSTLSENPALLQAGVGALTSSESSSANYVRIRR